MSHERMTIILMLFTWILVLMIGIVEVPTLRYNTETNLTELKEMLRFEIRKDLMRHTHERHQQDKVILNDE